jgi:AraC-like DNA-binding protein
MVCAMGSATPVSQDSLLTLRFSTDDYSEEDRLAAWREIFGRTVCQLDIAPLPAARFRSDSTIYALPGLGVLCGSCTGVRLSHTRELIADDELSFMTGAMETWTASQLGRNPMLGPGDGVLMTNAEVGEMVLPTATRFTTFKVPANAIAPLVPDIGAAIARRVPSTSAELRLLVRYLGVLREEGTLQSPELRRAAVTHVYDLFALALGATRDAAEIANGRGLRAARLQAIKADIAVSAGRSDLTIDAISAHHGVTPRYVQMLFEMEGTTFSQFLLGQRLLRAHRLLNDPRRADRTISAIAFEVGFNDLSYFNRTFRRRFAGSPSDVRAAARGPRLSSIKRAGTGQGPGTSF